MMRYIIGMCLFWSIGIINHTLLAQELLTLKQALQIALEQNYSIQIAKNEAEASRTNNAPGNAGMLPSVVGTVQQDNQVIDTRQKFLSGSENNRSGARSNSLNANIELSWTLFDGFKMFAARNRLQELEQMGTLRLRIQVEQTCQRVIRAYYDVVLAKQQVTVSKQAVARSQKRYEYIEARYQSGKVARTELLKAQVDRNNDESNARRQEAAYKNAQLVLNQLLVREPLSSFDVQDSLGSGPVYALSDLLRVSEKENAQLQLAEKSKYVGMLNLREIKAERLPQLQWRSGYNFSRSESEAGFLQSSQNNGLHYGATLSMNLFNGMDVHRRLQLAKLNLRSSELVYKDSVSRVQQALHTAYNNYITSKDLTEFERQNREVARTHYEIAEAQYKEGVITALELRDAEQQYLLSGMRELQVQYETRMHEMELLRLSGQLLTRYVP